ncbi:hypothetical protein P152DRAFT_172061 [Eremomyces bilateralis CBS 781.70]|uniref:Uncharacterized protein n=1 Tax=Eremomyces bilateralis CBS 781.70 TaxID=1392243 RepID=A0A6G1FU03_9PEZI|nr:uncharacterized protein P152DRAFT_172061 [Eremomyces bilateralis CBS 781.70]KAF1809186.1 hypothetical protein P152DRAFT_172061 [Eremomyces bilateralis CBS 781.70]
MSMHDAATSAAYCRLGASPTSSRTTLAFGSTIAMLDIADPYTREEVEKFFSPDHRAHLRALLHSRDFEARYWIFQVQNLHPVQFGLVASPWVSEFLVRGWLHLYKGFGHIQSHHWRSWVRFQAEQKKEEITEARNLVHRCHVPKFGPLLPNISSTLMKVRFSAYLGCGKRNSFRRE